MNHVIQQAKYNILNQIRKVARETIGDIVIADDNNLLISNNLSNGSIN